MAMKTTQAWGWLAAGVLAAGLNASYHDGGLPVAHEVVSRLESRSEALLTLASARTEQFLAETAAETRLVTARDEAASCRLSTALAQAQTRMARSDARLARVEVMSASDEAQLARFEANRAEIEAQVEEAQDQIQEAQDEAQDRI
jgi:septal ring factor EnvC (AmiA/AmiB activator)